VRLSLPESIVDDEVQETQAWLAVFVVAVMAAAGLVAWVLARSIAAPLRDLAEVAEELPEDLDRRARTQDGPPEVRAVASALNSTAERLSGILSRTQRVAADASHHLRTPLTGVRLRLEAIEDITDQPDVAREARAATAEVDRLTHRIEQVLELARSDASAVPVVAQDLSAIVAERMDAAAVIADERGVLLTGDIKPGVTVDAPRGSMARVVDELIGNALAYARSAIDLRLAVESGYTVLSVSDDGPGVPDSEREAVLERFHRGAGSVAGGSGLGLALVKETVTSLGGSVRVERSPAGGARFVLDVPRG
jgi:signal transduction histidine kinase